MPGIGKNTFFTTSFCNKDISLCMNFPNFKLVYIVLNTGIDDDFGGPYTRQVHNIKPSFPTLLH